MVPPIADAAWAKLSANSAHAMRFPDVRPP